MIETLVRTASDGALTGARYVRPSGAGAGATALIFVHGVGSTAAIWDRQLEAFGNDYACAAIELRGNGALKPDPNPALITRAGFAQDVLTVLKALEIERFTLVGCSLGGVVAFELWGIAGPRFDALVTLGSFARYPNGQQVAEQISQAVRDAGSMPAFAQRRAAQLGLPPERMAETIEQMACKSVPCYLASTQATWTGDYSPMLSWVVVPALAAYGEFDPVAPRELSEEIAAGIPGASLAAVEKAGHVANADNPAGFNALLRRFLDPLDLKG
ncbi:MAG TPA: alpha/beta fold hydrolase [Candidatus Cybelea sp.]|nr:alpha/beta fold hydrolase [Candidatus Cybelea sp.]